MTIQSDPVPSELIRELWEAIGDYSLQCAKTGELAPSEYLVSAVDEIARTLAPTRETAPALSELSAETVCAAINAIGDEASRRGEMYPQTSDEQREDRASVRRVCEMVRWYEKNTGCARIKGWPAIKADREQRPAALSEATSPPPDRKFQKLLAEAVLLMEQNDFATLSHVPKYRAALKDAGVEFLTEREYEEARYDAKF